MKKYITIILTILFLSGCTVRGPSVTVDPGGVYIPEPKSRPAIQIREKVVHQD